MGRVYWRWKYHQYWYLRLDDRALPESRSRSQSAARRGGPAALRWLCLVWVTLFAGAQVALAQEFETDAASAARGGLWVLGRLEESPGASCSYARALQVDAWLPWMGTEMGAASVRIEVGGGRGAAALRVAQLRAPVGSLSAFSVAGAVAWHSCRAGAALECRSLRLGDAPALVVPVLRLGGGAWVGSSLRACAALEIVPPQQAAGRAALGCELRLLAAVRIAAQIEQSLGVGSAVRLGAECGDGELRFLAGFDPGTRAVSVGIGWQGGRRGVSWGARTHPQLGWSHWWTCTFGSRLPAG